MKKLNMDYPIWLRALLCLTLSVAMILLFVKIYGLYRIYKKYPELVKSLELGEQMISHGYISRDCFYVDFENYPELKKKGFINLGQPDSTYAKEKFLQSKLDIQCIQDAKLISIEYKYGHARATYTCEKEGVVTEVTWTDFDDSCSYMKHLKSWNLPVGYSLLSINRP